MAMNDDMGLVFSGEMGLGLYLFSVVHLMNITHPWCSDVRPVLHPALPTLAGMTGLKIIAPLALPGMPLR